MTQIEAIGSHSSQYQAKYTETEVNQYTLEFSELTKGFAQSMAEGLDPSSLKVQELVRKHYEFCSMFWKPTGDSYLGLAMSYILPSTYRDHYESIGKGLGQYHYDAIAFWVSTKPSNPQDSA